MSWQVEMRGGARGGSIYLPQIDLWLDAHRPADTSFVSHAHFDHLAKHRRIITSAGTARLMATRLPGEREEIVEPFRQPFAFADAELTLHPAGHIFGSAMLLATREGESLLYTGDFKLRPGRSAERCEPPRADVVIMETTFGLPRYVFPPTADVLAAIIKFCRQTLEDGEVPVLFGYSLGKSQEILSSLADAALPVMLHPQTVKMTRIYEELGQTFPPYRPFTLTEVAGHVVVCPPQANQSAWLRKIKPRRTVAITGWANDPAAIYRYQCDAAFPLSDHADYADLLHFVELVRPKRVFTVHGYVEEFARTLRGRGIEAWALGVDNQLEISMAELNRPSVAAGLGPRPVGEATEPAETSDSPATGVEPTPATPETAPLDPNETRAFATVGEKIGATTRKLEKVDLLKNYFAALAPDALGPAAIAFTGKPFPSADGRTLNCGWAIIKAALLAISSMSEADYRATYQRYSDTGDTAQAILHGHTTHEPWPVADWPRFFGELAATRGPLDKKTLLQARLARLDPLAAKFLLKIITGDLRIGLKEGLVEEAIAAAFERPPEAIREGNMLSGDLGATARAAREGTLEKLELRTFNPIHFMLASPEPTAEAIVERLGDPIWVEEKYDGIRCQVHKEGARVEFYSRELRRITGQFPDLAARVREIPADFIADGELLAWQEGRALPFAELQKRLGRKGDDFFLGAEVPVSLWLYDLIGVGGRSLLKLPLRERRAQLDALPLVPRIERAPFQQVSGAAAVEAAFLQARRRGNEGLMAKDPTSIYLPGRRGLAWLKLKKAYATLDVVVVGVEWGHGKRRHVLSDYTFAIRDESTGALLPVGKAYSGLTDAEIAHYTEFFLQHTLEEKGRYRLVQPVVVLEVAFDTIQKSDRHASGYALRFPRILRIRDDKPVSEIDTLAYCRALADQALHGWKIEAPAT
jgi:DNA ligase-1